MAAQLHLQLLLAMFVPAIAQLEMKFTKYPESVIAPLGDRVTFECEVNVPGERFVWRWKPDRDDVQWTEVVDGDGKKIIPGLPGRSTKLEIEVMMNLETTWFQCVVWYGAVSLTSVPARLSVARLINAGDRVTAEERVISAPLHNTVILHCKEPASEPPAVLTWWKEGSKGKRKQLETPHGVLVIHNATSDDSGTYSCRATNELSGEALDVAQKTHLNVQREGSREVRFLESEEYVGVIDDDVLTMPVKPNGVLRLWCGAVSTPPPKISWSLEGEGELKTFANQHMLMISPFTPANEGVYACSANGIRRSWKVLALQPPHWDGNVSVSTPNEGGKAHVTCGNSFGQPPPEVYWVLNSELLKNEKGIKANNTDLYIEHVEKRHAGIVQCFACNALGCAYGAGMLSVVPLQIPDQDYPVEVPKTRYSVQPPKRHNRKNPRKHKAVMIPPSRPNVTRLNDESVMVSWSHDNQGLPIRFFKVQYREVSNSSNVQWNTANQDIPSYIHSYQIDGLTPGKYYKFRIAAVYSNQDNKSGKSSARFHLQRGGFKAPRAPVLARAVAMSPTTIQLEWTWSSGGEVEAEGFYVYYRAVSSAGAYEKVTAAGGARALTLTHLAPDTSYDIKLQAYTAQAASEFSAIKTAKTLRPATGTSHNSAGTSVSSGGAAGGAGGGAGTRGAPGALVTAGGALGAAALLVLLAIALLLCRRARRPTADKEKGSVPETGNTNGYIPAKVPITITANPMHSEGGDAGVEMSFLHNNNTGNNDDTLPHSRKNGPAPRQYV
ncbi:LOW QUALITY PROTEIN: interference hedgehog-like [Spodoptera frugiperda]|uniref:LOW QUALITY PROTEIN: interference hedgehog-like n=1 Tax=Spodoptera frugiperda TaxID=7108 RepID=A0A9R0DP75_SPOFR|nr:LOW QUALITY PROTEIN: interference hedgehog-like [Spodoptera frugiperda]